MFNKIIDFNTSLFNTVVPIIQTRNVTLDSSITDGSWHHLCISWKKNEGKYRIYVDQQVKLQGDGYKTWQNINAGGEFIFGQGFATQGRLD